METTVDAFTAYEQERGKPVPSINHSLIQTALVLAIAPYRDRLSICSELTIDLGALRVTPDLSLYPKMEVDLTRDRVRATEPPLLAVEIASATQSVQDLVDKARAMIEAGVASVWIVQPALRTVTLLDEALRPRTFTEGTLTDPATDVELDVEALFAAA